MRGGNNCAPDNLGSIGTGIQYERQKGRIEGFPENGLPERFLNAWNLGNAIIDNIKLNQQRCAMKQIGVKPDRTGYKRIFHSAENGKWYGAHQADNQR